MADFDVRGSVRVDVADFIRDADRVQRELRGIAQEADRTDRALRQLSSRRVVVDVEIRGGQRLDLLWDQLEAMATTTYNIKVEVDVAEAVSRVLQLEALLVRLSATPVNVDVDVNLAGAIANLSAFVAALAALNGTSVNVTANVNRDMNQMAMAAGGAARGMSGLGMSMSGLLGPMAVLATAIIPVVSALAGLAAGAFGAFSAVGVGIASFAAFAVPSIKKVTEGATALAKAQEALKSATTADQIKKALADQKAILDGLSPLQQQAIKNLNDFKKAYGEMSKALEPTTMRVFAEGLNFARAGLEGLFQVAGPAGDALAGVLKKASEGLKGESWTKFFDYMKNNVGFFVDTWLTGFGNIITAIGNLIVAFDPLSKDVSNGFLGMSERFLEWSKHLDTNKSFQNWMKSVKEDGPKVWEVVKDIAGTLMDLAKALAPIGARVIEILGKIANFTNGLRESNPQLYQMITNFAAVALVLMPLIGPLTTLVGLFITMGGLALGIAGAFILVAAGLAILYTKSEEFREAVNKLVTQGLQFLQDKWREIKEDFERIWPGLVRMWEIYGGTILTFIRSTWEAIKLVFSGALDVIMGILKVFVGLFTGDWDLMWEGIKQLFTGAGDVLAGIFQFTIDRIILIVSLFGDWLKAAFGDYFKAAADKVKEWWDKAVQWTKDFGSDTLDALETVFVELPVKAALWFGNFVKGMYEQLARALTGIPGWGKWLLDQFGLIDMWNAGAALLQDFWDGMKSKWEAVKNWFSDAMDTLTGWLPGSPAKRGALSGRGWTKYRGQALISNFQEGMESRTPSLFATTDSIVNRLTLGGGFATGFPGDQGFVPVNRDMSGFDMDQLEKILNRPIIIQVDSQEIARAAENGSKSLDRRR